METDNDTNNVLENYNIQIIKQYFNIIISY